LKQVPALANSEHDKQCLAVRKEKKERKPNTSCFSVMRKMLYNISGGIKSKQDSDSSADIDLGSNESVNTCIAEIGD
jgi:hypothetical protein